MKKKTKRGEAQTGLRRDACRSAAGRTPASYLPSALTLHPASAEPRCGKARRVLSQEAVRRTGILGCTRTAQSLLSS